MKNLFSNFFAIFRFRDYSLRIKFLVSILLVSILSVAVIGYFGYNRIQQFQSSLAGEFQTTVQQQSRQQLNDTARTEANSADQLLLALSTNVEALASYRSSLYSRSSTFQTGSYWDGHTQIIQLAEGQYGNSKSDIASIFIPNTLSPNETMIADLNTSAYLDFAVPGVMKSNQTIIAMYFISKEGATTYYPNISLAENVPADFDARTQPFYTIATPESNPERKTVWTPPYQDPAGSGLIVTNAAPVYDQEGQFRGVLSADVQLVKISDQIGAIQVGQTGFAFLIDSAGRLLAIHEASTNAFRIFGLSYEPVPVNETPKQTVLGRGPVDLQNLTNQMVAGGSGLEIITINKIDYYVSYAPLPTIGYSLGLIVPVKELDAPYLAAREQMENATQTTLNLSVVILVVVLMLGTGASLILSQSISKPLVELTEVVRQISLGNLGMRAQAETQDETGVLAQAVNKMTAQLRDLIQSLEQRVAERTKALSSVAEVSTAASTILETDKLLQQVVDLSKERFNLYHSHIYLLDEAGENLVLASGAGEAGRVMVAEGRSIPLNREQSLVARAARERIGVTVNDVTQEPDFLPNPLLPDTRSELAVPMIVGDNVLGVFDVQSDVTGRFTEADINIQTTLASQIATALQNARSFTQAELQRRQNELILGSAGEGIFGLDKQGNHTFVNPAGAEMLGYSIEELIGQHSHTMWHHTHADGTPFPSEECPIYLTIKDGRVHQGEEYFIRKEGTGFHVSFSSVPIQEGDRITGAVVTFADITQQKRERETIVQRAQQQEALNRITQKIQSTTSIEAALQIAARELGHALGMKSTQVTLEPAALTDKREGVRND